MREGRSQNDDREEREMEEGEGGEDVFEMLKTDHRHVQDLFTKFEDADKRARASIADETLTALEVHGAATVRTRLRRKRASWSTVIRARPRIRKRATASRSGMTCSPLTRPSGRMRSRARTKRTARITIIRSR